MHKMFSGRLFTKEMKSLWIMLIIFIAIISMYVSVIISMFDPAQAGILDQFAKDMPQMMSAVGMSAGATTITGFMASYLYGFILLIVPLIFTIICANNLVARYTDRGSLVSLLAAPVKRSAVALTQMWVLIFCIVILVAYTTGLQIIVAQYYFPNQVVVGQLLLLNLGLLCLHLFIGGICFLCSCAFNDVKNSLTYGAGIPLVMYILQAMANMGGKVENVKYFTFFSLFNSTNILAWHPYAFWEYGSLGLGAVLLFWIAIAVFSKKNLNI